MKFDKGIEQVIAVGLDAEGYIHILSRLDADETEAVLLDVIDIIKEDIPSSFTMQ
jgi:hypothetical protein